MAWLYKKPFFIVAAIVIAVIYLALLFSSKGLAQPYWLSTDPNEFIWGNAICDFVPFIALLFNLSWIGIKAYTGSGKRLKILVFILPLLSCCILSYFSLHIDEEKDRHLAEVQLNSHLYRLAFWATDLSSGSYYILFQCDSLGILCEDVFSLPADHSEDQQPTLSVDIDSRSVFVMDGNKVLYTYHQE